MLVYTCPKCGGDLEETVLLSCPPKHKVCCKNCGWTHVNQEKICRIPYPITLDPANTDNIPEPCRNCSGHPSNGGTGVCFGTLGSPTITY